MRRPRADPWGLRLGSDSGGSRRNLRSIDVCALHENRYVRWIPLCPLSQGTDYVRGEIELLGLRLQCNQLRVRLQYRWSFGPDRG